MTDRFDSKTGLSATAKRFLPLDVQARVAEAWSRGRALILNANKESYSEAFTIESAQYSLLRTTILEAIDALSVGGEPVLLERVRLFVQEKLGKHPLFPNGRMTNYTRYTKTDMEARGELQRVIKSGPQRILRLSSDQVRSSGEQSRRRVQAGTDRRK